GRVDAWPDERVDDEVGAEGARLLAGRHLLRDLLVVDERLVEAARLPLRQDAREEIELGVARPEVARRLPGEGHLGELDLIGHRLADDAGEGRLLVAEAGRPRVDRL